MLKREDFLLWCIGLVLSSLLVGGVAGLLLMIGSVFVSELAR